MPCAAPIPRYPAGLIRDQLDIQEPAYVAETRCDREGRAPAAFIEHLAAPLDRERTQVASAEGNITLVRWGEVKMPNHPRVTGPGVRTLARTDKKVADVIEA